MEVPSDADSRAAEATSLKKTGASRSVKPSEDWKVYSSPQNR